MQEMALQYLTIHNQAYYSNALLQIIMPDAYIKNVLSPS